MAMLLKRKKKKLEFRKKFRKKKTWMKLKSRSVFKEDQDETALLLISDKELQPRGSLLKIDK